MSNMLAQFHERWSAVESFFVRVMKPLNDKRKLEPFNRTARTWGGKQTDPDLAGSPEMSALAAAGRRNLSELGMYLLLQGPLCWERRMCRE